MAKFNNNQNNSKKDDNDKTFPQKKKTTYVKKKFKIAYSNFYADAIDSLYNLLDEITWDKVSIPVKMSRAELFKDRNLKGAVEIGSVYKFSNDNTFTVSMTKENAKAVTDKHVINIKCFKNKATGEISYISELTLTNRMKSINDNFADIEAAFNSASEESSAETE